MSAYAKSGFAKDANGRTYEERQAAKAREDLEDEVRRLRRQVREKSPASPSRRPFRGFPA